MAHGLANSWQALAGLRGLLGLAEGSANPAGMKATAEWFPARERGLAGGLFNIGASFGSMLAPPLVAWAILVYNWQAAFVITGGDRARLGRALALASIDSPDRHRALAHEERAAHRRRARRRTCERRRPPVDARILRQRNFWGIAMPRFLADPTWGTLTFWVPLYLSQVRALRPEADRAVRLDAVPGRRLRLLRSAAPSASSLQTRAASRSSTRAAGPSPSAPC